MFFANVGLRAAPAAGDGGQASDGNRTARPPREAL